jgi:hypothetical protein
MPVVSLDVRFRGQSIAPGEDRFESSLTYAKEPRKDFFCVLGRRLMSGELFKAMAKIDRRRPCVQGLFNLLFYELLDSFRCLKATGILLIDGGW